MPVLVDSGWKLADREFDCVSDSLSSWRFYCTLACRPIYRVRHREEWVAAWCSRCGVQHRGPLKVDELLRYRLYSQVPHWKLATASLLCNT